MDVVAEYPTYMLKEGNGIHWSPWQGRPVLVQLGMVLSNGLGAHTHTHTKIQAWPRTQPWTVELGADVSPSFLPVQKIFLC